MMHFAKSPTIPIDYFYYMFMSIPDWRNYNTIEKMEIQRDAQKLIKDATKIEAPTEVEDLDGAKFNLSEHENIRKGYVTIDRIRSLIIKEMIKDQTTAEHIGYFEDRPFRCRLLAMHRTLKNPLNIILEAKIIKVNDADICQLMDSKRNHIRYRRVSGVFWRDNPDNNKMDETLASELGLEEEV
ncbi:uncharacterized protein LOC126835904 [Adelges cooleyi]|uniref:uncharacterized protein LOC126835904 n=1 Tax=Adelges cooleyi TaxID=133065 RepID=UPI00217F37F8|nr:uncharacterized protein LOC126835904 [Adelges cooleyi]